MGKLFLAGIVAAAIYGVWGISGHIHRLTNPQPAQAVSLAPEGEDSREPIKAAPVASSSEKITVDHKDEPLPVVSSNHEWIQIEAWGIIGPGDPMPDGATLESWDKWGAVVRTLSGELERRRFRTFAEAMAKIVPAVAAGTVPGPGLGGNK